MDINNREDWFDIMDNKMQTLYDRQESIHKQALAKVEDGEWLQQGMTANLE